MPLLTRLLRAGETKLVKRLGGSPTHIDTLEADVAGLTDAELRAKTDEFRDRLRRRRVARRAAARGVRRGPRGGASARSASATSRVQLMGGAALHLGNIAEMKTGEGKTLTVVLPAYLNALAGNGVHVVTTNDYLAKRDAENDGPGPPLPRPDRRRDPLRRCRPPMRREQYACDITYGTNNEFGFDYLRDNMAWNTADLVQRGHHFAIVDEVDSILIDEARTPLIISGPAEQSARWYQEFARIAPLLKRDIALRGRRAQAHRRRHRGRRRRSSRTSSASTTSTRRPTPRWSAT